MKTPTQWRPLDSGTTTTDNENVVRVTQDGETRITQDSVTRVLNESVVSGKTPTDWTNND